MRKIRVGIDCDGVLRDFIGKTMELASEEGLHFQRPTDWNYIDNYEIDGKTLRAKIWDGDWLKEIFVESDVLPFAKKGYNAFVNDDLFEVYIVTSQFEGTEFLTDKWLRKNGFDGHTRTYFLFDKLKAPVQILIDDKPSHIEAFEENLREGYLINSSHNQDYKFHRKVDNLYDAYKQITEKYVKGEVV